MEVFGNIALRAVSLMKEGLELHPRYAWERAAGEFLNNNMKDKGCPKSAFLGLCEDGYVEGIPEGVYTKSIKNKRYAINMVKLLCQGKRYSAPEELWIDALSEEPNPPATENGQRDVVLALWHGNLIKCLKRKVTP